MASKWLVKCSKIVGFRSYWTMSCEKASLYKHVKKHFSCEINIWLVRFSKFWDFLIVMKRVFGKCPIFGVKTFWMFFFLKITWTSGTFNATCTAQQGQNTINLSLKCQNKPVILMRVDSQHNSRLSFQENFARILRKFPEIWDFRG